MFWDTIETEPKASLVDVTGSFNSLGDGLLSKFQIDWLFTALQYMSYSLNSSTRAYIGDCYTGY